MTETQQGLLQNLVEGFSSTGFQDEIKSEAMKTLQELGFPTTKNEEWKYTNLSNLVSKSFQISAGKHSHQATREQIKRFRLDSFKSNRLVLINGVFIPEASTTFSPAHELEILSFQDAKKLNHPLFKQHFSKYAQLKDGFTAANTAFAFRLGELADGDLHSLAAFRKVTNNYIKMKKLLAHGK